MSSVVRLGLAVTLTAFVNFSTSGQAAYLNLNDYERAIGGAKNQQTVLPTQSVTFADEYGSFTAATRNVPVDTSAIPPGFVPNFQASNPSPLADRSFMGSAFTPGSAGSLQGNFACHSFFYGCLGVDVITYKLPFAIQAIAGSLTIKEWYGGELAGSIPFFEFTRQGFPYATQTTEYAPGSYYAGFWGRTFDTPTDTLTIAWRPYDGGADFLLSGVQVVPARIGNNGNGPVPVPEPGALALLLFGLAALRVAHGRAARP